MNVQKEVATKTAQFTVPIKNNSINKKSKNSAGEIDDNRRFLAVVDRCFIISYLMFHYYYHIYSLDDD